MLRTILFALVAVIVLIQVVPVDRSNPEVTQDVVAPDGVRAVLTNSCYDCHSNKTVWPWYSYVAPVSWLVAHDVKEARAHFNFSNWDKYNDEKRTHIIEEIVEEVEAERMPLPIYLLMHKEAKPGPGDIQTLKDWYASLDNDSERAEHERAEANQREHQGHDEDGFAK